jgi:hypothetical protein
MLVLGVCALALAPTAARRTAALQASRVLVRREKVVETAFFMRESSLQQRVNELLLSGGNFLSSIFFKKNFPGVSKRKRMCTPANFQNCSVRFAVRRPCFLLAPMSARLNVSICSRTGNRKKGRDGSRPFRFDAPRRATAHRAMPESLQVFWTMWIGSPNTALLQAVELVNVMWAY